MIFSKKPIITSLLLTSSLLAFSQYTPSAGSQKFDALLQYINYAYVDTTNENELVEKAIVAVLKDLDPHSVYIPKKELKKMNEPLVGNFDGIGIQFNILRDTLLVVSPISGGPSEKVGLRAGDKIIEVDDEGIAGIGLQNSDVQKKLRGKKGTKVKVGVKRKDVKEKLDFTITRDAIPILSVDASYMVTKDIGYIKINRFAQNTVKEYQEGFQKLKEQNMQHLILDLRGNGGGYLKTAIELADEFLDEKKLIVYTKGVKSPEQKYFTGEKGGFEKGKLVVLIDEGSASASEIVSGAIQDYDRGLIIGRRSFGKGLVQKPFSLTDGSAIRLTVARYYTPAGRCIQKAYNEGKDAYYKEIRDRFSNGELVNKDSISLPDSLKFETINSQRTVYGGGGIMPDLFVAIDTSMGSKYFGKINRKGLMNEFTLTYMDSYREKLKKEYPTIADFKANYNTEKEILDEFIAYADKNGVKKNEKQIEISKKLITKRLKATLARNLWNTSAYFEIISDIDNTLQRAIEEINSDTFKKEKLVYK